MICTWCDREITGQASWPMTDVPMHPECATRFHRELADNQPAFAPMPQAGGTETVPSLLRDIDEFIEHRILRT